LASIQGVSSSRTSGDDPTLIDEVDRVHDNFFATRRQSSTVPELNTTAVIFRRLPRPIETTDDRLIGDDFGPLRAASFLDGMAAPMNRIAPQSDASPMTPSPLNLLAYKI